VWLGCQLPSASGAARLSTSFGGPPLLLFNSKPAIYLQLDMQSHSMSNSESLRSEGNRLFKSALELAPVLRRSRLDQAKDFYSRSFAAALNSEDRASAQGNISAIYHRLLEMSCLPSQVTAFNDAILHHTSLAIKYGSESNSKPLPWLLSKKLDALKFAQSLCVRLDAEESHDRFPAYIGRLYHSAFADGSSTLIPEVRLTLFHGIFKQHFLQAVRLIESSNHLAAIQQLEDSRRASVEAQSLCLRHPPSESQVVEGEVGKQAEVVQLFTEIQSDLSVLREDTLLQMAVARSGQMILVGNELLKNAVFGSASLNTCGVMDAIDCFRQAIVHARGVDIEHEAWANSRLGHTYSQVLKQPANGHVRYKECIQLAMSLYPRRSDSKPWFIEATRAVAAYQELINSRDQAETDKRRAPILAQLSVELGALKAASSKSADALLEHVYSTFGAKDTPARDTETTVLKQLLKAILAFHPDKCEQDDVKKKTLREEIVKCLNHHYSVAKGD
jgi:hypothetical protein